MRGVFFGFVLAAGLPACAHSPGEMGRNEGMAGQLGPNPAAPFTPHPPRFPVRSNRGTRKSEG